MARRNRAADLAERERLVVISSRAPRSGWVVEMTGSEDSAPTPGEKNALGARALGGEGREPEPVPGRAPADASQPAGTEDVNECGIARCVTNVLLALFTIGISGVVGVAQLRRFQQTRRTWRLLFAVAALANSAGVLVILVLLLTGVYG